ncbi:hypothetical protein Mycsm_06417 [Mycobacterium sp. JS623]|uniref:hypothetical protein n=1 Tax=Mycobacterium sp. JS623 TaxID=212767 RepID=UPI0002A55D30|nr:hypothetical protein [Mycobacterium sp. JS623]AGB26568.1 hypothetical protein Mycsm_06417 [Mycobacterium sp. JS623]
MFAQPSRARQTKKEHKPVKTTRIMELALIGTATAPDSHRRVLLQSRTVKLIGLLLAVTVAACAHTSAPTSETSKASPATAVPTPGTGAVTFEYLQRAPVPAVCEHDPGELRNGQLPPQEGHRGNVGIALNYNTAAYKVAFGNLTGGAGGAAMVIHCNAGGVGWPESVQLYTAGPQLSTAGPKWLGGIDLGDLTHGGSEIVTDLSISDGVAHVTWMANGPNDGACCPTVEMMADLRWDGSTVVAQNVRRAN